MAKASRAEPGAIRLRKLTSQDDALLCRAYLEEGLSTADIVELTGWDLEKTMEMEKLILHHEELRIAGMQPEEVYARFVLASEGNLRKCDELYEQFQQAEQVAGLVGLIKTKQTIMKDVLKTGQDMGFVRKEPTRNLVIVANMTDEDLKSMVAEKLTKFRRALSSAGDRDILDVGAEVAPSRPPRAELPPREERIVLASSAVSVVRRKAVSPSTLGANDD